MGHMILLEASDEFNKAVESFMDKEVDADLVQTKYPLFSSLFSFMYLLEAVSARSRAERLKYQDLH